jgi:hypothetical protein
MLEAALSAVADQDQVVRRLTNDEAVVSFRWSPSFFVALHLMRAGELSPWNVADLAIRSTDASGGLTGKVVRDLPLGEFIQRARASLGQSGAESPRSLKRPSDVSLAPFLEKKARDRTDRDFAELALEYVMRIQEGDRRPAASLAATFGGSANTWSNRILEARKRDLLTAVSRGEAGGMLTVKAHDILFGPDDE